jgi:hypothetical protein
VPKEHLKDIMPKIRNNYSQKRNCTATAPFSHSCFCERFIYSPIGLLILLYENSWTGPGNIHMFAHRHMNVEIGTEATQFHFWEYINRNFFAVRFDCQKVKNCLVFLMYDTCLRSGHSLGRMWL